MKKLIFIILICPLLIFGQSMTRTSIEDSMKNIVGTIDSAMFVDILWDDFAKNGVFKADVINSDVAAGSAFAADFDSIDTYEIDAGAGNVEITISNLQDGQIGFIDVVNKAGGIVTWANATNITPNHSYITALTTCLYMVVNKNGSMYAMAWKKTITTATATNSGILEVATTAEAQALTLDTKIITPSGLADVIGSVTINVDTVAIGNWDMDATGSVTVAHGKTLANILYVNVIIISDSEILRYPLNYAITSTGVASGNWFLGVTNITLSRVPTPGAFDNIGFDDDTSFNRGWIIIYSIP